MNEGERKLVEFQYGMSGSFYTKFFEAAFNADGYNLARLGVGFPEEIEAVKRFRGEPNYWQDLEKEFKTV